MFFGKRDKDVRLTDKQYKSLIGGMSKKERKDLVHLQYKVRDWDRLRVVFLT